MNAVHRKHPSIDFLISTDAPTCTALSADRNNFIISDGGKDIGLENSRINHAPFNIGITWWANRKSSVEILQRFADTVATITEVDQWPINLMLREGLTRMLERGLVKDPAVYPVVNNTYGMGVLNVLQFSSALVYSVIQQWRTENVNPYGVHFTYVQNQNLESKVPMLLHCLNFSFVISILSRIRPSMRMGLMLPTAPDRS